MDELFSRQSVVLRNLISGYREGVVGLNTLIQRIEGIGNVLGVEAWQEAVFPMVVKMEQVNAVALDQKRGLTEKEKTVIGNSLLDLECVIKRFEETQITQRNAEPGPEKLFP